MDGEPDSWTDGHSCGSADERTNGWVVGWMDGFKDEGDSTSVITVRDEQ